MRHLATILLGIILVLFTATGVFLVVAVSNNQDENPQIPQVTRIPASATPTPTHTPPPTPTSTPTITPTLRPPPTFEPPTPAPSNTPVPSETPTPTFELAVDLEGVRGLETLVPTVPTGCIPRADWQQVYYVQANDTLTTIAQRYGVNVNQLVAANCLDDPNLIRTGQQIRLPGTGGPMPVVYICSAWELLTPVNYAFGIDGNGNLTFNWRGPRADRYLIRVTKPNGTLWERTVDRRQNETISLLDELPDEGEYRWQVFPLGLDFLQIPCPESPIWTFHKTTSEASDPNLDFGITLPFADTNDSSQR